MSKHLLSFVIIIGLSCQLFSSCQKKEVEPAKQETQPDVGAETPGYFLISSDVYTASSPNARIAGTNADTQFDLGALKASKEFLFMIANGGGEPIFDITLTSDNAPFEVSPKSIKTLPGKNQGGIIPLITIGVTHGIVLNGIGSAPNLPRGIQSATIRMKGKTLSSHDKAGNFLAKKDTIEVIAEFIVKVDAKVLDAKIFSGGIEATLAVEQYYVYAPRLIVEPSKTVKIVNTGSVTIDATITYHKFIREPNPIFAMGYSTKEVPMSNKITLLPDQEIDITNMICPKRIEYTEGDLTIIYEGYTSISMEIKGTVYNVYGFSLTSQ